MRPYMNTPDTIPPRPKLKDLEIDWTDEFAQKILKQYINWSDESDENHLKDDLHKCFEHMTLRGLNTENGFTLAVFLTDELNCEGDERLVDILGLMPDLLKKLFDKKIKEWVVNNNLSIPENVLGQNVIAKTGFQTIEGPIVNIIQEKHTVWIGKPGQSIDVKSGRVVDWESVTQIA